jgi:hypothetical protein
VKWSAPTEAADDRADDCASGADDVAGPAQSAKFYVFKWSLTAIASRFVMVFQFLPVPVVFSFFSMSAGESFDRPMPTGK